MEVNERDLEPILVAEERGVPELATSADGASTPVGGLSFIELWSEHERDLAREVEEAIASQRFADAVERCETLVSCVFASTAGLLGSTDAPREPALVPILLGLDGRRFLAFRAGVRDARSGGLVSARMALSAYAFAIEAKLARASIG